MRPPGIPSLTNSAFKVNQLIHHFRAEAQEDVGEKTIM
jgi:hypothetical protein